MIQRYREIVLPTDTASQIRQRINELCHLRKVLDTEYEAHLEQYPDAPYSDDWKADDEFLGLCRRIALVQGAIDALDELTSAAER